MRQADNPMAERPMTERLTGKVIMITGAASGIGAAIARRCVAEGASVVCADHSSDAAANLAEALGTAAMAVRCDVTDQRSMERAVEAVRARFGRLDGLVHNAAAPSLDGTVVDLSEEQWRLEIDVSLTGAFLASKFAIPLMISGGGGSIVLIASQFGHVATGKAVAYCAAKAGLVHLAKAMAVDHAADGIRVNSLSPGAVATPRLLQRWPDLVAANESLGPAHLLGRIGQPDEIAAAAAFLLSSDAAFVTGTDLLVDGGYATR
jgi:NAD(P)-dependent dehydrogenase (short-subunit alcohol dehydrogenase family)